MVGILTLAEGSAGGSWLGIPLHTLAYAMFVLLIVGLLALDLGVFHRTAHEVKFREAAMWSVVWVACGLAFSGFVYVAYERHWLDLGLDTPMYNPAARTDTTAELVVSGTVGGAQALQQYLTGYVIEKSLSMDNIFVIALIFGFLGIPAKYQHRVLFWGIVGAVVMRGGMIFLGARIVADYEWVLIFFGLLLLASAAKMALLNHQPHPERNIVVRAVRRIYPVRTFFDGQRFFTRRTLPPTYSRDASGREVQDPPPPGSLSARLAITPLFLALVMVEITDLVFAVDSIPAIFAITPDPFIVFTSNIFAVLGLRSLYFCLAALISKFRYLKPALILILAFVGVKLLLISLPPYLDDLGLTAEPKRPIKINTAVSMSVVFGTLALAVVASLLHRTKRGEPPH